MNDEPGRRANRHRQRVGDRVVHRDELEVEGRHRHAFAFGDRGHHRVETVLAQLRLDQSQRQPRPDQWNVATFAQQVWHRPDVVLVPVGQHQAHDVVEPVTQ